ncbi:hypothetical protein M422DRAFT_250368 [Sphaerobolus stellatus SS14]|uniref:Uncharacterized protein n=1 Tax=Sphaerobolus stellatus (strain SS14) TaxID=990650 RepID=A0A0C9W3E9_SPHS4|nr:hypothetical protein M422DRAFT_250368 [Sphaerobolus stellatus SS14]
MSQKSYRVFLGAPKTGSLCAVGQSSSWHTVNSSEVPPLLPPATLERAEHRISMLYKNVIFHQEEDEVVEQLMSQEGDETGISRGESSNSAELSNISWLKGPGSYGEQETFDSDETGDGTTMLSEGSSIGRFPSFSFNVNTLSSLFVISRIKKSAPGPPRVALLLGILEVDGPSYVKAKSGLQRDSEMALLKLVAGDEKGSICKIVAWREIAETWGGDRGEPAFRRGDVVYFENLVLSTQRGQATSESAEAGIQFTASPNQKSHALICYRTLPAYNGDRKLRPDLRLSYNSPAVRKVSEVVEWMERMAGIIDRR